MTPLGGGLGSGESENLHLHQALKGPGARASLQVLASMIVEEKVWPPILQVGKQALVVLNWAVSSRANSKSCSCAAFQHAVLGTLRARGQTRSRPSFTGVTKGQQWAMGGGEEVTSRAGGWVFGDRQLHLLLRKLPSEEFEPSFRRDSPSASSLADCFDSRELSSRQSLELTCVAGGFPGGTSWPADSRH